ncbi:hypothetical protein [Rhodanobacter sp. L36]|uniref:hypothetical protein n=1 Tax=Rhodanobacter sp. L36 TaxID=1747221 RepID=UPI00131A75D2|nr:hypothetical protein [Rhodanobacter sp. L36]
MLHMRFCRNGIDDASNGAVDSQKLDEAFAPWESVTNAMEACLHAHHVVAECREAGQPLRCASRVGRVADNVAEQGRYSHMTDGRW